MLGDLATSRNRTALALVISTVIVLGLASRKFALSLPGFVAANAGDALWTVAVFVTFAFCRPQTNSVLLGIAAFAMSVAVELSQLIEADWIGAIRGTLPGRLLLGSGFLWIDLVRYLVGACAATVMDWVWTRKISDRQVRSRSFAREKG